jgi:signal transduction histidine kinase
MLQEFLATNSDDLINRCRQKALRRRGPSLTGTALEHGVPVFLDQLIRTLQVECSTKPMGSHAGSARPGNGAAKRTEMGNSAVLHGRSFMHQGFTVEQVVRSYGDVCQSVMDLAFERHELISIEEFRTLNRCLDDVIADAVTEYSRQLGSDAEARHVEILNEQMGLLSSELLDLLQTATLAIAAIKVGNAGLRGATGTLLDRCMMTMREKIDLALATARVTAGMPLRHRLISLADFVGDIKSSAMLEAQASGCVLIVPDVDRELAMDVDADMLGIAVAKLLENGFKFTNAGTAVSLSAYAASDRVLIEVADHCGGLGAGAAENMFRPFSQNGEDHSKFVHGLSVCQRTVEANNGILRVQDIPGAGCVFTIDLPRHSM